jgi:hypothetical protein
LATSSRTTLRFIRLFSNVTATSNGVRDISLSFVAAVALALGLHGFDGSFFQLSALTPRLNCFGGCLFQFAQLTLRLNSFSGSLFPVALRVNAELVPIRLRKIDIVVLCSLLDVREGQSSIGIGDADDLIEPRHRIAHVLCIG